MAATVGVLGVVVMTTVGQLLSQQLKRDLRPGEMAMLREIPFGNDGDFSHRSMVHRMNGDLANDFGNLAQRVLSMINKNCRALIKLVLPVLFGAISDTAASSGNSARW